MFKTNEVVFFEPLWWHKQGNERYHDQSSLKFGDRIYFLGEIPNVPGHCLIFKEGIGIIDMIHPRDLRKAKEEEI